MKWLILISCVLVVSGCKSVKEVSDEESEGEPIGMVLKDVPCVSSFLSISFLDFEAVDLRMTDAGAELLFQETLIFDRWAGIEGLMSEGQNEKPFALRIWASPDIPFGEVRREIREAAKMGIAEIYVMVKSNDERFHGALKVDVLFDGRGVPRNSPTALGC